MKINVTGKRIALIGGAGFIGHNLAIKLSELGAEVHVVDSLQVNNLGAFTSDMEGNPSARLYIQLINERLDLLRRAEIPLHILDARDYHVLATHLGKLRPDVVIHLAAIAHANRANKDPYSTFDHSMRTLENALDSVRAYKPHFIYFSSSMVYGDFDGEEVKEDRQCSPIGIYGALKYSGEKLVQSYHQVFDLPFTIIRPSALYGERCVSRRVGQAFIENALRGKSLTVNGDGSDALDFTYIDDLVQGIVLCVARDAALNQTFNLTYGNSRSLTQLAELVLSEFNGVNLEHRARDALMPERGTLSVEKARTLLGYEPKFPIEVGFRKYINWYKEVAQAHPRLFS